MNDRRQTLKILGHATWAIPTMTASILPAHAQCSETSSNSMEFGPGTASFIVPDCAVEIQVTVAGGSGGDNNHIATNLGGTGSLVTGSLTVTPGEELTIIVGAGAPATNGVLTSSAPGASGYGNGGNGGVDTTDNNADPSLARASGSAGGGGSAILRQSTPLVVAGGGGGGGGGESLAANMPERFIGGAGGNGDEDGSSVTAEDGAQGLRGENGVGGAGGQNTVGINLPPPGNAGGPQDGGEGSTNFRQGGGGGGGGYGGGGGGGRGGGGGGGGSLTPAGGNLVPGGAPRGDGSILISWTGA